MPTAPKRACLVPGCMAYAEARGRCRDHAAPILEALARAYREREDPRAVEAMLRAGLAPGVDEAGREVRVRAAFDWYVADHTREPPPPERRAALEGVFLRDVVAPLTEAAP